jgi:hypothetical protein
MQLRYELQNAWMMFDYIKHVQGWMTMACHIYDQIYCKFMMTIVYDMQSKEMEVQCMLWKKLNALVEKKKGWVRPCSKGSWQIVCKKIRMLFKLFMGLEILRSRWLPKNECVFYWT